VRVLESSRVQNPDALNAKQEVIISVSYQCAVNVFTTRFSQRKQWNLTAVSIRIRFLTNVSTQGKITFLFLVIVVDWQRITRSDRTVTKPGASEGGVRPRMRNAVCLTDITGKLESISPRGKYCDLSQD
jgi:hypothetical protein